MTRLDRKEKSGEIAEEKEMEQRPEGDLSNLIINYFLPGWGFITGQW